MAIVRWGKDEPSDPIFVEWRDRKTKRGVVAYHLLGAMNTATGWSEPGHTPSAGFCVGNNNHSVGEQGRLSQTGVSGIRDVRIDDVEQGFSIAV